MAELTEEQQERLLPPFKALTEAESVAFKEATLAWYERQQEARRIKGNDYDLPYYDEWHHFFRAGLGCSR
jgi:hypothetical protein